MVYTICFVCQEGWGCGCVIVRMCLRVCVSLCLCCARARVHSCTNVCKVTFAHVYEYNTVPAVGPGAAMEGLNINEMNNELRKQAVSRGTKYLHQAAKMAKSLGFKPDEMKLLEGKPSMSSAKQALLEYTIQTQPLMIICCSRGLGAMGRMFLGSTSDFLVHNCKCSVVIVKSNPPEKQCNPQPDNSSGEKAALLSLK